MAGKTGEKYLGTGMARRAAKKKVQRKTRNQQALERARAARGRGKKK